MSIAYKFFPDSITFSGISFTLGAPVPDPIDFYIFRIKKIPPTTLAPDFRTFISSLDALLLYNDNMFTNSTRYVSICFDNAVTLEDQNYILIVTSADVPIDSSSITLSKYCKTNNGVWLIVGLIVLILIISIFLVIQG